MSNNFPQQIEHLLLTGAIEGDEILDLHRLLKSHMEGEISDQEMQTAIDVFDLELYLEAFGSDSSDLE